MQKNNSLRKIIAMVSTIAIFSAVFFIDAGNAEARQNNSKGRGNSRINTRSDGNRFQHQNFFNDRNFRSNKNYSKQNTFFRNRGFYGNAGFFRHRPKVVVYNSYPYSYNNNFCYPISYDSYSDSWYDYCNPYRINYPCNYYGGNSCNTCNSNYGCEY